MTDNQKLDVRFTGQVAEGFLLGDVKSKAAKLFNIDDKKIDAIFKGRMVSLKRNLNEEAAKKYQKILTQIGMVVVLQPTQEKTPEQKIEALAEKSAENNTKKRVEKREESITASAKKEELKANHENASSSEWDIDEVGVMLVAPAPEINPSVNTPTYSLADQTGNILNPEEVKTGEKKIIEPNVSHITINDVGEFLLTESEREPFEAAVVDVGHLSVNAVGEDLLASHEKKENIKNHVDTSAIQLID